MPAPRPDQSSRSRSGDAEVWPGPAPVPLPHPAPRRVAHPRLTFPERDGVLEGLEYVQPEKGLGLKVHQDLGQLPAG